MLVLALRSRRDPAAAGLAAQLVAGRTIDWERFVQSAAEEGVAALAYKALFRHPGLVPSAVLDRLHRSYLSTGAANAASDDELNGILRALAEASIEVTLLKGVSLSHFLYHDIALRPMLDVDLWVQPDRFSEAVECVKGLGFQPESIEDLELVQGFADRFGRKLDLAKPGPFMTAMELHSSPSLPFEYGSRLSPAWLWSQAEMRDLSGSPVRVLKPAAALLYLAVHLSNHDPLTWIWLYDLQELIEEEEITPEQMGAAKQFNLVPALRFALEECLALFPSERGSMLLDSLGATRISSRERLLFTVARKSPRSVLAGTFVGIVMLPGWEAKLQFLRARLFPDRAFLEHRYHPPARLPLPLLYLYRLFRGLSSLLSR